MPTGVGGTEVNVSKAGSYLDGKPEGDSSMTCKSPVRYKPLQAAMLYMVKAELLEPQSASVELVSVVMRLTKDLLHSDARREQ